LQFQDSVDILELRNPLAKETMRIPLASSRRAWMDCRAVALAEADLYELVGANTASYDSAGQKYMSRFIYILQSEIESERLYGALKLTSQL
jgi:hypothetical protein